MQKDATHDSRFPYVLVLIFLIFAAAIITAGYFNYRDYAQSFRTATEKNLSSIANLKVTELAQWRSERLGDGGALFKNPAFSSLVRRYFENSQDVDAREKLSVWLDRVKENFNYNRISLFDGQGLRRLTIPVDEPPPSSTLLKLISEVLRSKEIVLQDFYRHDADQRIYLSVLVPVIDTQDTSRVLGVLTLRIDPQQYLYSLIKRWPTPSQTAETLLVRRDGGDALFLNELRFKKDTALKLRIPLTLVNTPAVQAALGHEGIVEGVDYRGVPVIADVRAVHDSPWFMVARMDIEEVYAPMKERVRFMVLFIISLICVGGASLLFFWRQQRVRFYAERLRTSEALRASELRYRRLFESAKEGILILDAGTGMVVDVNPFLVELLGFSREAFLEKEIWELGFFKDIIASKDNFLELQENEYIRYEDLPLETAAGQRIEVEFISNVYLVNNKKVIQCNIRDITARKRAEVLLATQARIATIFATASDEEIYNQVLNVVLDVMQSPFGVFGYIDKDGANVVPTLTRQVWDKCQVPEKTIRFPRETWGDSSWPRALREGKPNYANSPSTKTPEGHVVINRHISLPIKHGREVIGLFQVANRVTDYTDADIERLQNIADFIAPSLSARLSRERYENELRETNAELTRFVYTMSHDLKSPLVTVKTFLGYLEKDMLKQDAERMEKDFTYIRGAADKMGQLLDELLELTRIGRVVNPEVQAPLQDIVQDALNLVAGRIAERGVQVEVTQTPLLLFGDRVRLVELFQNLIDNAVRFMGDQSEPLVEIGLKIKSGEKLLFVRDNGMGIDPRHIGKLFGLFEKLDPATEGTGMGLALVKRIVEVHGGRIWVESEGVGKGSCFLFTLKGKDQGPECMVRG